ncbi:CenpB-DNA-bind-domain-containing protein [Wilcoxina mikolae CBS 423.85]|nr:CenpB-DNA-bind-domain-containing protein [Wilcoxina mikolae CBS 423.85]
MDGVQNPHDEYVNQQWVDLGMQQHHHGQHTLSPHHHAHAHHPQQHDYGAHYGYVESPGFPPPDSPFRLQPPPIPIAPNYLGMPQQWGQAMPPPAPPPVTSSQQYPPMPQAIAPAPPQLAAASALPPTVSNPTQSTSTPRRTLTDADRRRMCIFHEENPNVKQTEIGAMFGVERSTVSKVLRQKEKYLFPDDGSRSPIKRSKGKFPDIERALSVWAKNTRKQGITLTDVMIREKARFFATSLGISDSHFKANSAGWLEKFKHKNNVHPNGRGRSESDVTGIARGSAAAILSPRLSHARTESTPDANGIGEHRDGSGSPMMMKHSKSQDSNHTGTDSPDSYMPMDFGGGYKAFQHQHSGPTSPASPFFSPDSRIDSAHPSPGFPSRMAPGTHQRPRSQTFPLMPIDGTYISPPPSSEPLTPKMLNQTVPLASPAPEVPNPLASPHMTPSSSHTALSLNGNPDPPSGVAPTKDDAKKALEVVISFLRQQPVGFVEQDEYNLVGKLLEKFGLGSGGQIEADTNMSFSNNSP